MAKVKLQGMYKKFPGGVMAVSDFNLDIRDKEFIILVGPSGCGKSTTLQIAGLESYRGEAVYRRQARKRHPKDRDIAWCSRARATHMVFENMAFGLKLRKTPKEEIKRASRKPPRYSISPTCLTASPLRFPAPEAARRARPRDSAQPGLPA